MTDPVAPVEVGVLGAVTAWDATGAEVALKGPRHRAVLARLVVARGRSVPLSVLVDDVWADPPANPTGAIRTFVGDLRRALEPDRPPRARPAVLITAGDGYALRLPEERLDATRFEAALRAARVAGAAAAAAGLAEALSWWRGPAYERFGDEPWARADRARLAELRLQAVELSARSRLSLGRAAEVIGDLDAHLAEQPWREAAWGMLAEALRDTGRQAEALAVLRRARDMLVERLGLDPGPELRRLETDILRQADRPDTDRPDTDRPATDRPNTGRLDTDRSDTDRPNTDRPDTDRSDTDRSATDRPGPDGSDTDRRATDRSATDRPGADRTGGGPPAAPADRAERVWLRATESYRTSAGARSRLRSTVELLRTLAVTGGPGLVDARAQRLDTIRAAEQLGDVELTARVIGSYDVPAIWSRADDEQQAAAVVAAARRTLARLPAASPPTIRARLLATIAVESRGGGAPEARRAAEQAVAIARAATDPALLVFALNGSFLQSFGRTGLAAQRDAIGAELVAVATDGGLTTHQLLGHLVRMQARGALGDFAGADAHARAADTIAAAYESPLVAVFTSWYRAMRLAAAGDAAAAVAAYRAAAATLDGAGMPGLRDGLHALALLAVRRTTGTPAQTAGVVDFGPYRPWTQPLVLLAAGRAGAAAEALRAVPDPPRDHLTEALWCLVGDAATQLGDRVAAARAQAALLPAAGELAGAGSGVLTLGPVADHLARLARTTDG